MGQVSNNSQPAMLSSRLRPITPGGQRSPAYSFLTPLPAGDSASDRSHRWSVYSGTKILLLLALGAAALGSVTAVGSELYSGTPGIPFRGLDRRKSQPDPAQLQQQQQVRAAVEQSDDEDDASVKAQRHLESMKQRMARNQALRQRIEAALEARSQSSLRKASTTAASTSEIELGPPRIVKVEKEAPQSPSATNSPVPPSPLPPAAAAAPKTRATTVAPHVPTLVIGVPTIPRPGGEDYLLRMLRYIKEQRASETDDSGSDVPGPYPLRVRLVVMNNRRPPLQAGTQPSYAAGEATHPVFSEARQEFCPKEAGCVTRAVTVPGSSWEGGGMEGATHYVTGPPPQPDDESSNKKGISVSFAVNGRALTPDGDDEGNPNVPGWRVRQQTRDVSDLMTLAHALHGQTADYYMFAEDDFRLCPSGLKALAFLLARASHPAYAATADWNAIRVSFGLNGAIIHMSDVPVLAAYFRQHVARRPPDHMTVEWFAGEKPQSSAAKRGRPHVAFRYNLLEHFGFSSSLRAQQSPTYAFCYDEMLDGVVFEVEAFKPAQCDHDVLWPCQPKGEALAADVQQSLPDAAAAGLDFASLQANAKADSVQTWAKG